ncbi:hypothetical protein GIY23_16825 [Allosaccharopolyspora coralli]|uniref:DUF8017 domain-containing protein n=1 Tax=Allosaccharopolyspora coralli TaxID=2665642 RepID=A0A5Q3QJE2_9PSEU|nr:hypothetical protein [Allosaccharopolyspora coralli]QGK70957.1 hypothetical protein GIY23_16825 [Allosaccharopolyspora coralli]
MTWPNNGQNNWGHQPPPQSGHQYTGNYSGFGMFEEPLRDGRKPRRRKWLTITAVVVAVLALAGGVAAALVFGGTTPQRPAPQAAPPPAPTSTTFVPPDAPEPVVPGWQVAYNPLGQIAYDVPPDWQVLPENDTWSAPTLGNVVFQGLSNGAPYSCGGGFVRGQVGSTAVEQAQPIDVTANQFADAVGREIYRTTSPQMQLQLAPPQPLQIDGVEAVRVDATATLPPGNPCLPTEATISTVVFQAKESFVVVVAGADSAGGPPEPAAPGAEVVGQIVESARPVR